MYIQVLFIIDLDMSSQEQKLTQQIQTVVDKQKENYKKIQHSFEIATIITFILLGCCTILVIQYREIAFTNNIYVIQIGSFKIALISFFCAFIFRQILQKISVKYLQNWLHPKYKIRSKQEMQQKLNKTGQHIYDLLFHTSMTLFCYYFFKNEEWFPTVLGGHGECANISNTFSPWPKQHQAAVNLVQIEIGSYLYLIADVLFLKQKQLRKFNFGELIFHHALAICLILSGVFFNQVKLIIIGILIHDLSDIFRSFNRVIGDLKLSFIFPSLFTLSFMLSFGVWIFTRIMVLPICLIMQLVDIIPNRNSQGWFVIPAGLFGVAISVGLFFLQCYWSVILLRAFKSEKRRNMEYAIAVQRMKQKQK